MQLPFSVLFKFMAGDIAVIGVMRTVRNAFPLFQQLDFFRRNPANNAISVGERFCNNGSCSHNRPIAQFNTRHNFRPRSNPAIFPDFNPRVKVLARIIWIMISSYNRYIRCNLSVIAYKQTAPTCNITSTHDTRVSIYADDYFLRVIDFAGPMNRPVSLAVATPIQDLLLKPKLKIGPVLIIGRFINKPEQGEGLCNQYNW